MNFSLLMLNFKFFVYIIFANFPRQGVPHLAPRPQESFGALVHLSPLMTMIVFVKKDLLGQTTTYIDDEIRGFKGDLLHDFLIHNNFL